MATVHLQIGRLLEGSSVRPDDLDDGAFDLVGVHLPRSQVCAEAVSNAGLRALGLPDTYPTSQSGEEVPHGVCQSVGKQVRAEGLRHHRIEPQQ